MPRFEGATYFDLKGGLNTEASPINIAPTDCIDIENLDINVDGSIQRRSAIDFLGVASSGSLYRDSDVSDYTTVSSDGSFVAEVPSFTQYTPINAEGGLDRFVVVHLGTQLIIYNYETAGQLREIDLEEQVIDLSSTGTDQQALYRTSFLQDNNKLFIINPKVALQYISYDSTALAGSKFSMTATTVQYRDNSDEITSVLTDIPSGATDGWSTGCMAGSRLWLAGTLSKANTLYYSQTVIDGEGYNKAYQAADPFDATDNLLVDTDGGSIQLTSAEKIMALVEFGGGVIVFASNGIWSVSGQDGFRPTAYSINKISDEGLIGQQAWCEVDQQLVFFGISNIHTILQGTALDTPTVTPIGDKIVTFYNSIPLYNRQTGRAVYNPDRKKLQFLTNFESSFWNKSFNPYRQATMHRDSLVLDVRLAAWYTYKLSEDALGSSVAIGDAAVLSGGRLSESTVITTTNNVVVDSVGDTVVAQDPLVTSSSLVVNLLLMKRTGNSWKVSFGELVANGMVDFTSSTDGDSESNAAHITLAHQLFKDIAHRKFVPYMIPIFERIESGVLDNDGVDLTPGGCKYRVDWDWSFNSSSNKFGTLRDAYRPYSWTTANYDGADQGTSIVTSKLKIRGMGEVLRLHFESDGDKDFKLLGWQLMMHAKRRV